jgi:hypothetical protein
MRVPPLLLAGPPGLRPRLGAGAVSYSGRISYKQAAGDVEAIDCKSYAGIADGKRSNYFFLLFAKRV